MTEDWQEGGFGLYIHWPFCQAKCPYCDFNSHVSATIDQTAWAAAYEDEIARVSAEVPGRVVQSVFFGGGTPSLMDAGTVARVMKAIRKGWSLANDVEVTLEANPTSVEAARLAGYRQAGVNRVSLGVQALDHGHLKRLGRLHSVTEALKALETARTHFDRVSIDLMYGLQDQSLTSWEHDLQRAVGFGTTHLSLYQLTIEPETAFGARFAAGKLPGLPDEGLSEAFFETTRQICAAAGFAQYEVSNFAKDGSGSRHNLIYWRAGDYAGIGPGAHGRLTLGGTKYATVAKRVPGDWLKAVAVRGSGEEPRVAIPKEEQATEYLMMSLRLSEGLDLARYERLAGSPLQREALSSLIDLGLVTCEGGRVRATSRGQLLLNPVIGRLIPDAVSAA